MVLHVCEIPSFAKKKESFSQIPRSSVRITYLTMMPTGRITECCTSAHYEPHLYVDAVGDVSGEIGHHQPVVCVGTHGDVTCRIDAVDVTDWRRITRFSPL